MKKIFLSLSLILFSTLCFGQYKLSYMYKANSFDVEKEVICTITFYENNYYELKFIMIPTDGDLSDSHCISSGKYSVNKNIIWLTDNVHGFKMKAVILEDKKIKFLQGYFFLNGIIFFTDIEGKFVYRGENVETMTPAIQKKQRLEYKRSHKVLYPLTLGIYEGDPLYTSFCSSCKNYRLSIEWNNQYYLTYTFYSKEMLLSEGTWTKDGNELLLHDSILKHTFHVLIDEENLISKYLPGDTKGIVLVKKK